MKWPESLAKSVAWVPEDLGMQRVVALLGGEPGTGFCGDMVVRWRTFKGGERCALQENHHDTCWSARSTVWRRKK